MKSKRRKRKWAALVVGWTVFFTGFMMIADMVNTDELPTQQADCQVQFLGRNLALDSPVIYVVGKLYLPLRSFLQQMGAALEEEGHSYHIYWQGDVMELDWEDYSGRDLPLTYDYGEQEYVSLFEITQRMGLSVVFQTDPDTLALYYEKQTPQTVFYGEASQQKAYLRLEDLYSDGGLSGNLGHEQMEKLRAMGSYLYANGQSYYLAWIPFYINPPQQVYNDMTKNFSFYNADFLYTLDYLTHHGGHIVLHGYTHQENETISAVGYEFGADTPFSAEEIQERMRRAKDMAARLGYENNIFEFPHYGATAEQLEIAEKEFDVVYQRDFRQNSQQITEVKQWGNRTLYVPTPLDYIPSKAEMPAFLQKMDALPSDQLTSLFFHPYLDLESFTCYTTGQGERTFSVQPDSIVVQLVEKVQQKNMRFSEIALD